MQTQGQSSKAQRAIFEGLRKSGQEEIDSVETARLAARLRVLRFSDALQGDYINLCAEIVRGGTLEDGARLWARLLQLASENRATGGYVDLPKLIRILRPDFDLQDHPDFSPDWNKLDAVSADNIRGIRSVLGIGIELARAEERKSLASEVEAHKVVVIVGESGSGKSAMVSQISAPGGAFNRTIWLSAEQLSKTSQPELANAFGLSYSIPELISNSGTQGCSLVLDGFERFEGEARRRVVELLRAIKEEEFANWKVIVTCQPQSLDAAHNLLVEAGITDVHKVDFEKPKVQEILEAIGSVQSIRPLLLRAELQPILRNLMVLDWVLRTDVAQRIATSRWVGVTDLIDRIWERWTGESSKRLARDVLLRTLGKRREKS